MRNTLYLFGILNEADTAWMLATGRQERLQAGAILIHEGQVLDAMYIVLQGQFRVSMAVAGGAELARLRVGEVMGEISFVDSRPPAATVTAVEDAVVFAIPRQRLSAKLAEDTGFAARFYQALSMFLADRMRSAVSRLLNRSMDTPVDDDDDEALDPQVLQRMALAGARFDWMLKSLQGA